MSEKQNPRPWLTWLVLGLVLLVAYPASIIPAYQLAQHEYIPFSSVHAYYPLSFAREWLPRSLNETLLVWQIQID
jgi:hypothetical protein